MIILSSSMENSLDWLILIDYNPNRILLNCSNEWEIINLFQRLIHYFVNLKSPVDLRSIRKYVRQHFRFLSMMKEKQIINFARKIKHSYYRCRRDQVRVMNLTGSSRWTLDSGNVEFCFCLNLKLSIFSKEKSFENRKYQDDFLRDPTVPN